MMSKYSHTSYPDFDAVGSQPDVLHSDVRVVLQADQPHVLLPVPDVGGAVLHHNSAWLDVDAVLKQKLQVSMYSFLVRPDAHIPRFYLAFYCLAYTATVDPICQDRTGQH